jgi:hypothetical protein
MYQGAIKKGRNDSRVSVAAENETHILAVGSGFGYYIDYSCFLCIVFLYFEDTDIVQCCAKQQGLCFKKNVVFNKFAEFSKNFQF